MSDLNNVGRAGSALHDGAPVQEPKSNDLMCKGSTVIASTAVGTVAAVSAAAVVGAGMGVGWHYSGMGEYTGTDKIGDAVGDWVFDVLNPKYSHDALGYKAGEAFCASPAS